MGYFDTIDWQRIKADLQRGMEKGAVALRKGALVVQKRAGELSEEGKKQYKVMQLKSRAHTTVSDLGARVYAVMSTGRKNPAADTRVKDLVVQLKKLDAQIASLEGRRPAGRKPSARRRTRPA